MSDYNKIRQIIIIIIKANNLELHIYIPYLGYIES